MHENDVDVQSCVQDFFDMDESENNFSDTNSENSFESENGTSL